LNAAPKLSAKDVSVHENETVVQTGEATGVDDDALMFDQVGGPDKGLFAIDPNTGALTFKSSPD
jgi:hypothetical protein